MMGVLSTKITIPSFVWHVESLNALIWVWKQCKSYAMAFKQQCRSFSSCTMWIIDVKTDWSILNRLWWPKHLTMHCIHLILRYDLYSKLCCNAHLHLLKHAISQTGGQVELVFVFFRRCMERHGLGAYLHCLMIGWAVLHTVITNTHLEMLKFKIEQPFKDWCIQEHCLSNENLFHAIASTYSTGQSPTYHSAYKFGIDI